MRSDSFFGYTEKVDAAVTQVTVILGILHSNHLPTNRVAY